ncbi:VIM [Branchiostoma lanceolatum]|uniref:VIM protein n=1 Tax=Branchiostoma lanceolatum TaxID=7740 RepID=A0A8K0EEX6_BRALA|nr:VIM [Branchiostoma lanceolatum]
MSFSYTSSSGGGGGMANIKLGQGGVFSQVASSGGGGTLRSSWSLGGRTSMGGGVLNASSGALVPVRSSTTYTSYSYGGGPSVSSNVNFNATEKVEMQGLNDRLGRYIAKVRSLEEANRQLQIQINEASKDQVEDDGIDWAAELTAAREALLAANLDRARVEIARDSRLLEVNQWREKIEGEIEKRAVLEDELNMLKREQEELAMEKVDLEGQIEGAQGELDFIKQIHKQEVAELKERIKASGNIEIQSRMETVDLNAALKAIREQYEEIARRNRADVEKSFQDKVSAVKVEQAQSNEALTLVKSEINEIRRTLTGLQAELEALKAQQAAILDSIPSAERDTALAMEAKMEIISSLTGEVSRLKNDMERVLKEYQDLMNTKLALEAEINQYNSLLSGEETRMTQFSA